MKELNRFRQFLTEGVIKENEEQGYTLYTTKVEYDNGKTGYMYQLVNSEDREENEIGFDQLFFDDEDNRLEMGVDFNSFDQGSYQEGEYTADEAMELYRKISEGVIKESIDDNLFRDINVKFKKLKRYSLNRDTVERWADEYYTDSLPKTFGDEELEDLQSYLDRKYKLQGRGGYINFFGDDESIYNAEAPARNRIAQRELERKAMRYIEDNNIDLDKIYPDED